MFSTLSKLEDRPPLPRPRQVADAASGFKPLDLPWEPVLHLEAIGMGMAPVFIRRTASALCLSTVYLVLACVAVRLTRFHGGVAFISVANSLLLASLLTSRPARWLAPAIEIQCEAAGRARPRFSPRPVFATLTCIVGASAHGGLADRLFSGACVAPATACRGAPAHSLNMKRSRTARAWSWGGPDGGCAPRSGCRASRGSFRPRRPSRLALRPPARRSPPQRAGCGG